MKSAWPYFPQKIATTHIGSLPHISLDAALNYSFRTSIPFLPQLPRKNLREFMIPQTLWGFPGFKLSASGDYYLDRRDWESHQENLRECFQYYFSTPRTPVALFSPPVEAFEAWQPWLWELQEREIKLAKIQLTGPITIQWALRDETGAPVFNFPELSSQLYQWVLARSLAMHLTLKEKGIQTLLFLDEPSFYALNLKEPKHLLAIQELKILIQALKKEGCLVGLHCCSNTSWETLLPLEPDCLSLDTHISLRSLLKNKQVFEAYIKAERKIAFGVVPTNLSPAHPSSMKTYFEVFLKEIRDELQWDDPKIKSLLKHSIYTPACGLALHTIDSTENIKSELFEFTKQLS